MVKQDICSRCLKILPLEICSISWAKGVGGREEREVICCNCINKMSTEEFDILHYGAKDKKTL